MIDSFWATAHSDAFHPGTREGCSHCQEMIRVFGPMPSVEEILAIPIPDCSQTAKASIPTDLRWEVWERDNFTCQHCGTRRHLSIDHIIPESKGGTTVLENLQTLCKKCNSIKGVKVCERD